MRTLLLALAAALPLAAGCTMSHTQFVAADFVPSAATASEDGREEVEILGHVYANSWGLYLFAKLPYVAGGIDDEGFPEWRYWEDVVKVETAVDLLEAEARRRGATHVVDLKSDWISEWSAASLIFWVVETEVSATALRVTGEAPPDAIPLALDDAD